MAATIGIRRETKNAWERRAPLAPTHVRRLVDAGIRVVVQPSPTRVFPDAAYAEVGADVQDDLSGCQAIFAVKEIPEAELLPRKTYVFFSHTIKGQRHNMPLLQRLIDLGCRLIDYEKITDDRGRRLIFFGRHAGYAGMIDTLHVLGRRLAAEGVDSPFSPVGMAHSYQSLDAAKAHLRDVGATIARHGLPDALFPFVVAFAGYGNVSGGAQEVFDCLPVETLTPAQLHNIVPADLSRHKAYKVVFKEEDLVAPVTVSGLAMTGLEVSGQVVPGQATTGQATTSPGFDLAHYYSTPQAYEGRFRDYLPWFTAVMNCIYWEPRYPRLITRDDARALWAAGPAPRLKVIGDLGCDIEGPIEFTVKATDQADPTFVYVPREDRVLDGLDGDGPVVLAIDNLPCELPLESSLAFGDALFPFAEAIGRGDPAIPFEAAGLSGPIARAVITDQGSLTPAFAYLDAHLNAYVEAGVTP